VVGKNLYAKEKRLVKACFYRFRERPRTPSRTSVKFPAAWFKIFCGLLSQKWRLINKISAAYKFNISQYGITFW
jgi:hypothetical protein